MSNFNTLKQLNILIMILNKNLSVNFHRRFVVLRTTNSGNFKSLSHNLNYLYSYMILDKVSSTKQAKCLQSITYSQQSDAASATLEQLFSILLANTTGIDTFVSFSLTSFLINSLRYSAAQLYENCLLVSITRCLSTTQEVTDCVRTSTSVEKLIVFFIVIESHLQLHCNAEPLGDAGFYY